LKMPQKGDAIHNALSPLIRSTYWMYKIVKYQSDYYMMEQ